MNTEIWRDVLGYEHAYQISNLGRVKSKKRTSKSYKDGRSDGHAITEKIRKPSTKNGYYFLWLYNKDGSRRMEYVHRLVAIAFLEKTNLIIDHIDRDRKNNLVSNLRWTTQCVNIRNKPQGKGFYYCKKRKKYYVRITVNKIQYIIASCDTEVEAQEKIAWARRIANDAQLGYTIAVPTRSLS